ncbi:type IV pilin-like G/H family protein [Coleofasciculus sp.]|uniref:type IV pilin-like G/H family protein n=1 Tax=Coleofasciculus sp. TaxID=3100458 RepID=UPI0039F9B1E5
MKTELKAKFLQHLNQKKHDEGFTLIELLVVIIIIGILSAIALPSFLNQANKAKQSEAKQYIGSMNRAQQAYYLEKNEFVGEETEEFGKLGLGIATQTTNYVYKIKVGSAINKDVTNQAQQALEGAPLKAYVGGVQVGEVAGTGEATTIALLCEANKAAVQNAALDGEQQVDLADNPVCPDDYSNLGKG